MKFLVLLPSLLLASSVFAKTNWTCDYVIAESCLNKKDAPMCTLEVGGQSPLDITRTLTTLKCDKEFVVVPYEVSAGIYKGRTILTICCKASL